MILFLGEEAIWVTFFYINLTSKINERSLRSANKIKTGIARTTHSLRFVLRIRFAYFFFTVTFFFNIDKGSGWEGKMLRGAGAVGGGC